MTVTILTNPPEVSDTAKVWNHYSKGCAHSPVQLPSNSRGLQPLAPIQPWAREPRSPELNMLGRCSLCVCAHVCAHACVSSYMYPPTCVPQDRTRAGHCTDHCSCDLAGAGLSAWSGTETGQNEVHELRSCRLGPAWKPRTRCSGPASEAQGKVPCPT